MKVINGKRDGFIGSNKIYIGRANRYYNLEESPLHNPHKVGRDNDKVGRDNAIALYKVDLWKSIRRMRDGRPRRIDSVMAELIQIARREKELNQQGSEVELVCWCKEHNYHVDCHGDVVILALEWLGTQDWFTDWIR